jgi:RecA-family ATPase
MEVLKTGAPRATGPPGGSATPSTPLKTPYTPKLRSFAEVLHDPAPPADWLVEDVFASDDLLLFYGDWGSGKSFLLYHLALHIAAGRDWMGFKVPKAVTVAYHDEEMGQSRSDERLCALAQPLDLPDNLPLYICPPVGLRFFGLANRLKDMWKAKGINPKLVIIETARELLCGKGDENTAGDVRSAMKELRKLTLEGICVVLVHHMKKPSTEGNVDVRDRQSGTTDWQAAADTSLAVSRINDRLSRVSLVKPRRGEAKEELFYFTLSGNIRKEGWIRVLLTNPPPPVKKRTERRQDDESDDFNTTEP